MNLIEKLEKHLANLVEHKRDVPTALAELDDIVSVHKSLLDPQMAHFLERRSYEKALDAVREGSALKDDESSGS